LLSETLPSLEGRERPEILPDFVPKKIQPLAVPESLFHRASLQVMTAAMATGPNLKAASIE
jgi:hypothetical protein